MDDPNDGRPPRTRPATPICAIGASAGGIDALQTLFRLLPDDLGLAYVVIIHLAPEHPSILHEILGHCTRMPVIQVQAGTSIAPNHLYVGPPDRELVIDGEQLRTEPSRDARRSRLPIDAFFRSVGFTSGDGIAVVLTGAGEDGSLGVRAVKEAGGLVMVQEPAEAEFTGMPQAAVATGAVDVVAPLAGLAEQIAAVARSKRTLAALDAEDATGELRRITALVRQRMGHDFASYKRATVLRRVKRRMQIRHLASLAEYLVCLRDVADEAAALFADLLISVTMFFRDPDAFEVLRRRVVHSLLEELSDGQDLRAWVVGCATGEEAYSLAILLLEAADRQKVRPVIQIFATDLDQEALQIAREGRYPRSIEGQVSEERLRRFFIDEGTHYRVGQELRDRVLFALHSVIREPPFMRLDLISCRNVLIYMERPLQQQVCAIFHYGLKPDRYLFLGPAETTDIAQGLFAFLDREARLYRAQPVGVTALPLLHLPPPSGPPAAQSRQRPDPGEVLNTAHAAALKTSAPPSILVDADHAVLHLSPTAGRFILLPGGPLRARLPGIVRPELRFELIAALAQSFATRQPVLIGPVAVRFDDGWRRVILHVADVPVGEGVGARALVSFLDHGPSASEADAEGAAAPPSDELRHLHHELKAAHERVDAIHSEYETTVEDLRVANEELQSLNEEYRSTAKELETSKEELQSINEELQTVNGELKSKLSIISAAHTDLQNLTASSEIGTLFLHGDLQIRMFTPPVAALFNITASDIGRRLTDFTHHLSYEHLQRDARRVMRERIAIEDEVRSLDGRWFLMRIRPYRTLDDKVEGVILCQTAWNIDPGSASKIDPLAVMGATPLVSPAEPVGVAQPG